MKNERSRAMMGGAHLTFLGSAEGKVDLLLMMGGAHLTQD